MDHLAYNALATDTGYTVVFVGADGARGTETFSAYDDYENASLAADKMNADLALTPHFRPGGAARVADILSNALRRMYDREMAEEIWALDHVADPGEVEKRVWARIEAELNESKAKGFVIPRSLGG